MIKGLGIFLFTTASRPALGPTQPRIQWVPGALPLGVKPPGVNLTSHLHLVPRSRMRGAILPLPQYVFMAWCLVKSTGTTLPLPFFFSYLEFSAKVLSEAVCKYMGT